MTYQCPKCGKYGMGWDGRAKVLLCYYSSCNHVIRIKNQKNVPNSEVILAAIKRDLQFDLPNEQNKITDGKNND